LSNLFINLSHTEKNIQNNKFCAAGQLQNSTLSTNKTNLFQLPQLFLLENIEIFRIFQLQVNIFHETYLSSSLGSLKASVSAYAGEINLFFFHFKLRGG